MVREETRCRHIGYVFRLAAMVLLYAPSHRQDSTYHGLCYTSRGVKYFLIFILLRLNVNLYLLYHISVYSVVNYTYLSALTKPIQTVRNTFL